MALYLAPLAGFTDSPFRLICKSFGAKKLFTEMISIEGLAREHKRTLKYLEILEKDEPINVQLFGTNLDAYLKSLKYINKLKYIEGVNINCGCPVKKVIKTGAGAALMKNPKLLNQILKNIKDNTNKQLSIKIRSGWDKENVLDFLNDINLNYIDYLILHPRTVKQAYSGKANWNLFFEVKNKFNVKLIPNGDINSKNDIKTLSSSFEDLMIGRSAIGNPWIFCAYEKKLNHEFKNTVLKHLTLNEIFYGPGFFKNMKKQISYYFKNIDISKEEKNNLFTKLFRTDNLDEFKNILERFFYLNL